MSLIKNIVTFGAYGKVQEVKVVYDRVYDSYKYTLSMAKQEQRALERIIKKTMRLKVESAKQLHSWKIYFDKMDNLEKHYQMNVRKIENINGVLDGFTIGLAATTGTGIGVGTALGTWALVSSLGVASTGTAISTLSGAAATNATLAAIGGGAVGAGGGGMAVGSLVLGTIAVIPALIFAGIFSHYTANKQIEKMNKAIGEMRVEIPQLKVKTKSFIRTSSRLEKYNNAIKRKTKRFKKIFEKVKRIEEGNLPNFLKVMMNKYYNRRLIHIGNKLALLLNEPILRDYKHNFDKATGSEQFTPFNL